jgi:hypothetical protein
MRQLGNFEWYDLQPGETVQFRFIAPSPGGRRVLVDSAAGLQDLMVVDLKVGNRSQFVAAGVLPATMFTATSSDSGMINLRAGELGSIMLRNDGRVARRVQAGLL